MARTVALACSIQQTHQHQIPGCLRDAGDAGLIMCGAAFHDIGRINDGADPDHGFRAARQVLVAANQVALSLPEMLPVGRSEQDVWKGKLLDIVFHHCEFGPGTFIEMQICKDADRLDRFRLGPTALDPSRLALHVSEELMDEARRYVKGDMKQWKL
ncbi:hypothetical protein KAR91_62065 [Candidatus Pacearchaeota archaeon]|nr:hypothetical protein [Candidatus Pacearchaeota archaeon]